MQHGLNSVETRDHSPEQEKNLLSRLWNFGSRLVYKGIKGLVSLALDYSTKVEPDIQYYSNPTAKKIVRKINVSYRCNVDYLPSLVSMTLDCSTRPVPNIQYIKGEAEVYSNPRADYLPSSAEEKQSEEWADPTDILPSELCVHIMSFLSLSELANTKRVSSQWKNFSETNYIWKIKARELEMPLNWRQDLLTTKNRLKNFILAFIEHYLSSFPTKLMDALEGESQIVELPIIALDYVINTTNKSTIELVNLQDMQGAKLKLGIDCVGSPFLVICAKNNSERKSGALIQILYPRVTGDYDPHGVVWSWSTRGADIIPHMAVGGQLDYKYLKRLIRHKPCGVFNRNRIEGPRTLEDGRSVVELTDQLEFQVKSAIDSTAADTIRIFEGTKSFLTLNAIKNRFPRKAIFNEEIRRKRCGARMQGFRSDF